MLLLNFKPKWSKWWPWKKVKKAKSHRRKAKFSRNVLNVIKQRHKKSLVNATCKVVPKGIHSSLGRTRINTLGLTDCISHYLRALKTRVNELQVCLVGSAC